MRLIGYLEEEAGARTFSDYLLVQGIESQLDHHKEDGWAVWILDEDRIERATSLLTAFRTSSASKPTCFATVSSIAKRSRRG